MSLPEGYIARRLKIKGRVQGVGYRDWFVAKAAGLNLSGWVRNRKEGWVEALCVGSETEVMKATEIAWHGPYLAQVTGIEIEEVQGIIASGFKRMPTV